MTAIQAFIIYTSLGYIIGTVTFIALHLSQ